MTDKITLSRELVERAVMRPGKESLAVNNADIIARGRAQAEIRELLAHPVPPAGGDVKVLGYSVKGNRYAIRLTKGELLELSENYTGTVLIELVDRAHVTRLQAEVDHWSRLWGKAISAGAGLEEERDALQSELTKAREALREIICACGDERSHGYISMLAEDALSNQSAPADKGGDS